MSLVCPRLNISEHVFNIFLENGSQLVNEDTIAGCGTIISGLQTTVDKLFDDF